MQGRVELVELEVVVLPVVELRLITVKMLQSDFGSINRFTSTFVTGNLLCTETFARIHFLVGAMVMALGNLLETAISAQTWFGANFWN